VPGLVTTPPTIDFCKDVFPLFAAIRTDAPATQGRCSNVLCHAGTSQSVVTAQGLVLSSPEGIRHTAINVEATEATNAALSTPISSQPAFPVGMALIAPGDPGDSYLVYKLLLPDQNGAPDGGGAGFSYTTTCGGITPPFDYGPSPQLASAEEATRLSQLVPGRRMPWGDPVGQTFTTGGGTPLTLDELERISVWIAQGAQVVDGCSTFCTATHP
jgi:predicted CxxxxCH...CXXCH cytochrome family protein